MSHHTHNKDKMTPQEKEYLERMAKHDDRTDHVFRRALHYIERFIAILTILALMAALFLEIYHMFTQTGYFRDVGSMLHSLMTIVIGLEFVRMLIDTTPANILEVLTVAITRHVILSHEDPWTNVASVACIAGLFAIRRFLIRRHELKEEMVEED